MGQRGGRRVRHTNRFFFLEGCFQFEESQDGRLTQRYSISNHKVSTWNLKLHILVLTVIISRTVAVVTRGVVIVAIAAVSTVAIALVTVALVPVVSIALVPALALT